MWLKRRETVVDDYFIYYFFIIMNKKKCLKCWENRVKKDWRMRWRQRYKCIFCGYIFQNTTRKITGDILWEEYVWWKQTYQQLSEKYKLSIPTIQKKIDIVAVKKKREYRRKRYLLLIPRISEEVMGLWYSGAMN